VTGLLTDTSSNEDRDLAVEHVFCRCAERSINSYNWQWAATVASLYLSEVTTSAKGVLLVLLFTFHSGLGQSSYNRRASAKSISKSTGEVTDLTDVKGDVRILWRRRDCELTTPREVRLNALNMK
jgi:hypothetical protein